MNFDLAEDVRQTFAALTREAHDTAVDHGFWDGPTSVGTSIALMHSELSEALEVLRKDPEAVSEKCPCVLHIEEELADVMIRIFDFAGEHGYDLSTAVLEKMAYNATRPHKHGKQF